MSNSVDDMERIEEDEAAECRHCGEAVDVTEPGHYKSVSDEFWHQDCFAEYCYERRSLVATPEGSFKIKPVIVKEVEDGKAEVIDSFWRADCPVCYRTHESDEKTEDSRVPFIGQVTDCCDTEWLPPADWIEDCGICGDDHRESEGCTPLTWREPFPDADEHRYECTECDWSGEADDFDNHWGECPDCGTTAVRAVRVTTDGGIKRQEITDEFVRDEAVPVDEAESFVHLGLDDHYHPTGGYWFPTGKKWGEATGWVSRKYDIPQDELIQFPCDERPPEIRGRDDLPDWVVDRYVDTGDDR